MKHRVIITVAPGGKVSSRVEGISGPQCGEVTKFLDSLGQVTHTEDTPEAYLYTNQEENEDEKIDTGNKW